jgi:hypothetical protein
VAAATRVVCMFDREEDVVSAAAASRDRGLTVVDAYAPYPVHGLSEAMGLQRSRLPWVCFGLGAASGLAMLLLQHWTMSIDWPLNVGGRPWNSFPAYVPVAFEAIIFVAGLGTVAAFLAAARLHPWRNAETPDPRVTDDRFALVLFAKDPGERKTIHEVVARFRPVSIEERA